MSEKNAVHAIASGRISISHLRDMSIQMNSARPPLLIKLTCYRILTVVLVVPFVATKAILTYQGQSSATTLDWVLGGVITIG